MDESGWGGKDEDFAYNIVLVRLPCYDFTPITSFTFGGVLLAVRLPTSGPPGSHGVTGGVYKARERIHRGMLIHDY